jgi:hypothetical protein
MGAPVRGGSVVALLRHYHGAPGLGQNGHAPLPEDIGKGAGSGESYVFAADGQ